MVEVYGRVTFNAEVVYLKPPVLNQVSSTGSPASVSLSRVRVPSPPNILNLKGGYGCVPLGSERVVERLYTRLPLPLNHSELWIVVSL